MFRKKREKPDALVVVKDFIRKMNAGKVTQSDAMTISDELLVLKARIEKVRSMYPEVEGIGFNEDVETLIKLVGKQATVQTLRPKRIRRAASLL